MLPLGLSAQRTYSLSIGSGTSYYSGDLTGSFDTRLLRAGAMVGGTAYLMPGVSLRVAVAHATLSAADSLSDDLGRQIRNLHFRNRLYEGSGVIIWEPWPDKRFGRRYLKKPYLGPYLLMGVGLYYHSPEAQYQGTWHALQPLGTEGQYLADSKVAPYSRIQVSLPLGAGIGLRFAPRWGIRLEMTYRYTFTDYLDDVSTEYPDIELLRAQSEIAATLSDRSGGLAAGARRGSPTAKDAYATFSVQLEYFLSAFAK
ncbi:MAG: hypothetical protein OHK0039_31080 [Bacteroidia bacterium]